MNEQVNDIIDLDVFHAAPSDAPMEKKVEWIIERLSGQDIMQGSEVEEAKERRERAVAIWEQTELDLVNNAKSFYQSMSAEAQRMMAEAEAKMSEAERQKAQAEEDSKRLIENARKKAHELLEKAQADIENDRLTALKEVKAVLGRVETMKAAAQEELENQKILTNALEMKVNSSNWAYSAGPQFMTGHQAGESSPSAAQAGSASSRPSSKKGREASSK